MFNIAKDIAFSATGKNLINRKLDKFGEITHLTLPRFYSFLPYFTTEEATESAEWH